MSFKGNISNGAGRWSFRVNLGDEYIIPMRALFEVEITLNGSRSALIGVTHRESGLKVYQHEDFWWPYEHNWMSYDRHVRHGLRRCVRRIAYFEDLDFSRHGLRRPDKASNFVLERGVRPDGSHAWSSASFVGTEATSCYACGAISETPAGLLRCSAEPTII